MSWYTNLFVNENEFPSREGYKSISDMRKAAKDIDVQLDKIWDYICCLAFISPKDINCDGDVINYINEKLSASFKTYIDVYKHQDYMYRAVELWNEEEFHKDYIERYPEGPGYYEGMCDDDGNPITKEQYFDKLEEDRKNWKPSISWNHFEYGHNPEEGITENNKFIAKVKRELLALALANPKNIVKDDEDVIISITMKLDELREWLDERLTSLFFSELCVKYWDTHTEG